MSSKKSTSDADSSIVQKLSNSKVSPWTFATWKRSTYALFQSKFLSKYLDKEEASRFSEVKSSFPYFVRDPKAPQKIETPGAEDLNCTHSFEVATVDAYLSALQETRRQHGQVDKNREKHEEKLVEALDLLKSCLEPSLIASLRDAFATCNVKLVWDTIALECGPINDSDGLAVVLQEWTGIKWQKGETMQRLTQRMDELAASLTLYDRPPTAKEYTAILRSALRVHPEYTSAFRSLCTRYQMQTMSWTEIKADLHIQGNFLARDTALEDHAKAVPSEKALVAADVRRMVDDRIKASSAIGESATQNRNVADKNAPGNADEQAERRRRREQKLAKIKCYCCDTYGHYARDCTRKDSGKSSEPQKEKKERVCAAREHVHHTDGEHAIAQPCGEVAMSAVDVKPYIIDSRATSHCISDPSVKLESFCEKEELISLGNSNAKVLSHGRGKYGALENVMLAPQMSFSMVSPGTLDRDQQCSTILSNGVCTVVDRTKLNEIQNFVKTLQDNVVLRGTLRDGLYHVDTECPDQVLAAKDAPTGAAEPAVLAPRAVPNATAETAPNAVADEAAKEPDKPYAWNRNYRQIRGTQGTLRSGSTGTSNELEILHHRLGHASKKAILDLVRQDAVDGAQTTYNTIKNQEIRACEACLLGKMRADSIPRSESSKVKDLRPMQEIGLDPVPLSTRTYHGNSVFNVGLDYGTSFAFMYESKTEGDQKNVLMQIERDFCIPYGHKIRALHTDYHTIFLSAPFRQLLLKRGILFESSPPYRHEHNRVEGACIRPLLDNTRVLLEDSGLPPSFAGFAFQFAVDTWNRTLHPTNGQKTPHELVTGEKPDISNLRPFGAQVYFHQTKEERTLAKDPRFKEKASKGILLGNSKEVPGAYLVYTGPRGRVITRKQVLVMEGKESDILRCYTDRFRRGDPLTEREAAERAKDADGEQRNEAPQQEEPEKRVRARQDPDAQPTRASARLDARRTAVEAALTVQCSCCAEEMVCTATEGEPPPLPPTPRNIEQALNSAYSAQWQAAIEKERDTMLDPRHLKYEEYNGVPKRAMRGVLAFRVSQKDDGSMKFKARLCPDGSTQQHGVDFDQTYSPTARRESILMLMHLVATNDWDAYQMDVGSAFLEVPAQREQFMRLSDAMIRAGFSKTRYVRLLVNFYGTQDAGREWYIYIICKLVEFGMTQSIEEPCLFTMREEGKGRLLIVLLYVDDFMFTGSWTEMVHELQRFLTERLHKVELKPLSKFLGLETTRDRPRRTLTVSVDSSVDKLLAEHGKEYLQQSRPGYRKPDTDVPLCSSLQYRGLRGTEKPIWEVAGSLRYLADTSIWADLKVTASLLGSAGKFPHPNHRKGAEKALGFVQEHKDAHKLVLGGPGPVRLFAFADAAYTPEEDSTHLYGYALFLSPDAGAYCTKSRRSTTVAHSSLQAEMKGLSEACKDIEADRELLAELGYAQEEPTPVFTDSMSAIDLVSNVFGVHPKCRHFNRDINYVRQCVALGKVKLFHVRSDENPADLLTKLLAKEKHWMFTPQLLRGVGSAAIAIAAVAATVAMIFL
jgi:hypothetical protein